MMPLKPLTIFFLSLAITLQLMAQEFIDKASEFGIVQSYGDLGWEEFGGGISFYDFNGDGWDDLSIPTAFGDSLLFYQNNQGVFEKIEALAIQTEATKQLLWADIDNDGDQDLFVTNKGSANRLYENDGNMNLTDITVNAGFFLLPELTYGASFGDYDSDGDLDLYIANRSSGIFDSFTNYLWKNNGDNTFSNVSFQSNTFNGQKLSFCAGFIDINQNLFPDLYIINDRLDPNSMLLNNGDGTYTDISISSNTDTIINAMNAGIGDYDNDGDLDIYITNTLEGNVLLQNNGDETFNDVTAIADVAVNETCWGGNFFDYDNDGDLDLYVSKEKLGAGHNNSLFENNGDGTFQLAISEGIEGDTLRSFGNSICDFNRDGKMDIVVLNALGDPISIFENQTNNDNHWLKVGLEGVESNRDGIGSWIEIYTEGQKQVRYTQCGTAYLAQNSKLEHFGLGIFSGVDSIIVRWQSGKVDKLENIESNQIIQIEEGMTLTSVNKIPYPSATNFSIAPNPISDNFFHILKNDKEKTFDSEIELISSNGQIIFRKKVQFINDKIQIDFPPNQANGFYFLDIETEHFSERKKLLLAKDK